jgi:hypothetical protein
MMLASGVFTLKNYELGEANLRIHKRGRLDRHGRSNTIAPSAHKQGTNRASYIAFSGQLN